MGDIDKSAVDMISTQLERLMPLLARRMFFLLTASQPASPRTPRTKGAVMPSADVDGEYVGPYTEYFNPAIEKVIDSTSTNSAGKS